MVGYKTDTSMHVRHVTVVVIYVETAVYMGGLIWIRLCMHVMYSLYTSKWLSTWGVIRRICDFYYNYVYESLAWGK